MSRCDENYDERSSYNIVITHYLTGIWDNLSILWQYATDLALKFVKFSFPDECKLIMSHKQLISTIG